MKLPSKSQNSREQLSEFASHFTPQVDAKDRCLALFSFTFPLFSVSSYRALKTKAFGTERPILPPTAPPISAI